jgi:hypothetical protein
MMQAWRGACHKAFEPCAPTGANTSGGCCGNDAPQHARVADCSEDADASAERDAHCWFHSPFPLGTALFPSLAGADTGHPAGDVTRWHRPATPTKKRVLDLLPLHPRSVGTDNTGISCRASTLAPRAVSFIPLFYGTLILEV